MPIEYFETEPTKKPPSPDLLDRVIDTTEHHEHAVDETNSTYMQGYRLGQQLFRSAYETARQQLQRQPARAASRVKLRSTDLKSALWALGAIAFLLWILAITGGRNPSPATPAQATSTPTPTPILEKGTPHKAMRGRRR